MLLVVASPARLEACDRVRELARRHRPPRLGGGEDRRRKAELARHREPEALAERAVDQAKTRRETHRVDVDRGELDARLVQRVELDGGVVRRRRHERAAPHRVVDERDRERRALVGVGADTGLVPLRR